MIREYFDYTRDKIFEVLSLFVVRNKFVFA